MDKLYFGQTLWCQNGETVIITEITETKLKVKYKGKIYTREKVIIGDKLFTYNPNNFDSTIKKGSDSTIKNKSNTTIKKESNSPIKNDFDLPLKKKLPEPNSKVKQRDKKDIKVYVGNPDWPKYGDATYFRTHSYKRKK